MTNKNAVWGDLGTFVFSGFDDTITSFALAPSSGDIGIHGFSASDLSFTAHTISLRVRGCDAKHQIGLGDGYQRPNCCRRCA